jgi:hypothetical protein
MKNTHSEELWRLGQQSRVLQEFRANTRRVWNDQAAKDINGKYLEPHKDESSKMQKHLGEQRSALDQATAHIESAEGIGQKAAKCSTQTEQFLREAKEHTQSAYGHYEVCRRLQDDAKKRCDEVAALILEANGACGEVH